MKRARSDRGLIPARRNFDIAMAEATGSNPPFLPISDRVRHDFHASVDVPAAAIPCRCRRQQRLQQRPPVPAVGNGVGELAKFVGRLWRDRPLSIRRVRSEILIRLCMPPPHPSRRRHTYPAGSQPTIRQHHRSPRRPVARDPAAGRNAGRCAGRAGSIRPPPPPRAARTIAAVLIHLQSDDTFRADTRAAHRSPGKRFETRRGASRVNISSRPDRN